MHVDVFRFSIKAYICRTTVSPRVVLLNEMLAKHPRAAPPPLPVDSVPPPVQVAEVNVIKALRSFPSGTAPSQSGLRANHLKEAVFCPSPDRSNYVLLRLTKFINLLCAGNAPPAVTPHLCGASLFPCKKKDGGLRPIAAAEVLRCLTSKVYRQSSSIRGLQSPRPFASGWVWVSELAVRLSYML